MTEDKADQIKLQIEKKRAKIIEEIAQRWHGKDGELSTPSPELIALVERAVEPFYLDRF